MGSSYSNAHCICCSKQIAVLSGKFVPIEIHADFTDCHIIIRHCQMFGHNGQFFLIIGIYRSRMQPHHRKAISFVLRTNTKHGLYGRTIDVGHEDMSYSRCLSAGHHLLQIRLEFIQKRWECESTNLISLFLLFSGTIIINQAISTTQVQAFSLGVTPAYFCST